MAGEYPRLRDDLVVKRLEDDTVFVIKDPVTRRFFRLKAAEYFIASLLDGDTSLDAVARRFEAEFEMTISTAKLERFVAQLRRMGVLENGTGAAPAPSRAQRSPIQKALYFKIRTFDPDRFLGAVVSRAGFFFTPGFVVLAALLACTAVVITATNWSEYSAQLQGLMRPTMVPLILLIIFAVIMLHEFAHGLTCKYFGGEVHEIGILMMYFLPAFYCNVSDAWLFKDLRKRQWVSFAGVFFQVFIWAIAVIAWRVLETDTWLSDLCCIIMTSTGISTIFNLTPLLKLDGYYILADYLGIPNLRKHAFAYVGRAVKRWFRPDRAPRVPVAPRVKKIYLLYGVVAGVYSIGVLVFILFKTTEFMFDRLHGTGVIILYGAVLSVVTGSFEKLLSGVHSAVTTRKGSSVRSKRAMAWIGGTAVFVLVVTFGQWELKISRQSQVFASSRAQIRAAVDGTIREIFADEGDTVLSGSLIARLDDAPYRSDMLETAAEIEKRTAELTLLEKGPLDEEVRRLQSLVERENTRVSFAEREFERVSELRRKNLVSSAEFEGAKEQLELCRKDLDHARSDLDVLLTGTRPEQIESARAEIERLEVTHDFLEEQVARTDIVSPITGVVSTHHLRDRVGEYLEVGDELCRIVNPRTMLLEIPVSEKDVAHVDVGQRVKFRARSIPELAFHGRVTEIAPEASRNDDHTVFVVTSEVDNPDAILRPGMTGNAKIYCGRRRIVYLWTRQIIKFIRVEFWL